MPPDRTSRPVDRARDDDSPRPPRREPHAGDFLAVVKWVLVVVACGPFALSFFAHTSAAAAALAGLACFVGILARVVQAEQHRYPF